MNPPSERAKQLRSQGIPLKEIAKTLGVAVHTVVRWTDPAAHQRALESQRAHKERRRLLNQPALHPEGRVCTQCSTVLTRWNPGPDCFIHSEPEYEKNDSVIDLLHELEVA